MHHCADGLADRCARGSLLIVSIRKAGRTRPHSTAALCRDGGWWSLEAITGFANKPPVEEAVHATVELLAELNGRSATVAETPP